MFTWDIRQCPKCGKDIALIIDRENPTAVWCPCGTLLQISVQKAEEDEGGEEIKA
jgi:hypothetical protein